jgi:hypothetical protein
VVEWVANCAASEKERRDAMPEQSPLPQSGSGRWSVGPQPASREPPRSPEPRRLLIEQQETDRQRFVQRDAWESAAVVSASITFRAARARCRRVSGEPCEVIRTDVRTLRHRIARLASASLATLAEALGKTAHDGEDASDSEEVVSRSTIAA